jgi:hypothetical protein
MSLNVADLMTAKWTAWCCSNFEEIRRSVTKVADYEDFLSRRREKESFDWNDCRCRRAAGRVQIVIGVPELRRSAEHEGPSPGSERDARDDQYDTTTRAAALHFTETSAATLEDALAGTDWLLCSPEGSITSGRLLFEVPQSSSTAAGEPFTSFMRGFLQSAVKD